MVASDNPCAVWEITKSLNTSSTVLQDCPDKDSFLDTIQTSCFPEKWGGVGMRSDFWTEDGEKRKGKTPNFFRNQAFLAEDEGFEPPQTESESGVLPLHKSSIFPWGTLLLYPIFRKCQGQFLEFPGFFSDCQVSANRKKMHRMTSGLNGQILRLSGGHFLFVFVEFAECPWYIVKYRIKYRMDKNAYRLSTVNK